MNKMEVFRRIMKTSENSPLSMELMSIGAYTILVQAPTAGGQNELKALETRERISTHAPRRVLAHISCGVDILNSCAHTFHHSPSAVSLCGACCSREDCPIASHRKRGNGSLWSASMTWAGLRAHPCASVPESSPSRHFQANSRCKNLLRRAC